MAGIQNIAVKRIDPADLLDMSLFHEAKDNSRFAVDPEYNENKFKQVVLHCIAHPTEFLAIKTVSANTTTGYLLAEISSPIFSDRRIAYEQSFYVRESARGTRAAYLLFKGFFEWGRALGAKQAVTNINYSDDNSEAYTFCERMGMKEIGKIYEINLEGKRHV